MALQDLTTPHYKRRVIGDLTGALKHTAMKAANPQMMTEISQLSKSPSRVRKFTVESVCEMLEWVEDPVVIEAVVSSDPRTGVRDVARRRLRDLQALENAKLVSNQTNIVRRTARCLEKSPSEAVESIEQMNDYDAQMVSEWISNLSAADFSSLITNFSGNHFSSVRPAVFERLRLLIEKMSPSDAMIVFAEIPHPVVVEAFLTSYADTPWPASAGAFAAGSMESRYLPFSMRGRPRISQECEQYWRDTGNLDLLLWAGQATLDEVVAGMAAASDAVIERLARLLTSTEQVIALAAEVEKRGWKSGNTNVSSWDHGVESALGIKLPEDVQLRLLSTARQHLVVQWLQGRFVENLPTASSVQAASKWFLTAEHAESFMRASGEPDFDTLKDVYVTIAEHMPMSARAFFMSLNASWRSSATTTRISAEILSDLLGEDEAAWTMFWVLFKEDCTGTLFETAQAAQALV